MVVKNKKEGALSSEQDTADRSTSRGRQTLNSERPKQISGGAITRDGESFRSVCPKTGLSQALELQAIQEQYLAVSLPSSESVASKAQKSKRNDYSRRF